jgi:hypothetical protein
MEIVIIRGEINEHMGGRRLVLFEVPGCGDIVIQVRVCRVLSLECGE